MYVFLFIVFQWRILVNARCHLLRTGARLRWSSSSACVPRSPEPPRGSPSRCPPWLPLPFKANGPGMIFPTRPEDGTR